MLEDRRCRPGMVHLCPYIGEVISQQTYITRWVVPWSRVVQDKQMPITHQDKRLSPTLHRVTSCRQSYQVAWCRGSSTRRLHYAATDHPQGSIEQVRPSACCVRLRPSATNTCTPPQTLDTSRYSTGISDYCIENLHPSGSCTFLSISQ